jgi:hypothetical protein
MARHLSFISTAGHGYLVVRGDRANALSCATGYDYTSRRDDVVYLEEDLSATIYVRNFMTEDERADMPFFHRDELPTGLTRITEPGAIGAAYMKGKGY